MIWCKEILSFVIVAGNEHRGEGGWAMTQTGQGYLGLRVPVNY
jgi:hypothetical protein